MCASGETPKNILFYALGVEMEGRSLGATLHRTSVPPHPAVPRHPIVPRPAAPRPRDVWVLGSTSPNVKIQMTHI